MQATSGTMCYAGKCYVSSTVSFILDTYIDKPLKKERNEKVALKTDKKKQLMENLFTTQLKYKHFQIHHCA
jgi:hypothetical protein